MLSIQRGFEEGNFNNIEIEEFDTDQNIGTTEGQELRSSQNDYINVVQEFITNAFENIKQTFIERDTRDMINLFGGASGFAFAIVLLGAPLFLSWEVTALFLGLFMVGGFITAGLMGERNLIIIDERF